MYLQAHTFSQLTGFHNTRFSANARIGNGNLFQHYANFGDCTLLTQVAVVSISAMYSAQENVLRPVHVELSPGLARVKSVSEIC